MKWRKADRRVQLPQLKRLRAQSKHGSRGRERLPGAPFEPPSEQIYTTVRGVVLLNGYFIFGRAFKSTISNYPSLIRFCRSLYPFFLKQPFSAFSPFFLAFSPFLLPGNVSSLFFSFLFPSFFHRNRIRQAPIHRWQSHQHGRVIRPANFLDNQELNASNQRRFPSMQLVACISCSKHGNQGKINTAALFSTLLSTCGRRRHLLRRSFQTTTPTSLRENLRRSIARDPIAIWHNYLNSTLRGV